MSIRKFKQFESKVYVSPENSNDFTELDEIWQIICDLNIGGLSEISVFKRWYYKDVDIKDLKFNAVDNSCISHSRTENVQKLDKAYRIEIRLNKKLLNDIKLFLSFSEDFLTTVDRLQDLGQIKLNIDTSQDQSSSVNTRDHFLTYSILLIVKRK